MMEKLYTFSDYNDYQEINNLKRLVQWKHQKFSSEFMGLKHILNAVGKVLGLAKHFENTPELLFWSSECHTVCRYDKKACYFFSLLS